MASIYNRSDSQDYWLACYPEPGSRLVRASLGTNDRLQAECIRNKIELLIKLNSLRDVELPAVLAAKLGVDGLRPQGSEGTVAGGAVEKKPSAGDSDQIRKAVKAYLTRSAGSNVSHALADKVSRLRQFFGSALVNELDPRPPAAGKRAGSTIAPWYDQDTLAGITPDLIIEFLLERNYGRTSKRHFREMFHGLFRVAMVNGIYVPTNPYAPNPAAEMPTYKGKDGPIIFLGENDSARQYDALAGHQELQFGCRLMIEQGFRLHEIFAIKREHVAQDLSHIRLIMPLPRDSGVSPRLKTGERTVTVRAEFRPILEAYLKTCTTAHLVATPSGNAWNSDGFGKLLREVNRSAGLHWTSQDFRHTFATRRIAEGWNLKTLSDEMGTSIVMLMEHYAGYIAPPVMSVTGRS